MVDLRSRHFDRRGRKSLHGALYGSGLRFCRHKTGLRGLRHLPGFGHGDRSSLAFVNALSGLDQMASKTGSLDGLPATLHGASDVLRGPVARVGVKSSGQRLRSDHSLSRCLFVGLRTRTIRARPFDCFKVRIAFCDFCVLSGTRPQ